MEDRKQSSYVDADIATICVTSIDECTSTYTDWHFLGNFPIVLDFKHKLDKMRL